MDPHMHRKYEHISLAEKFYAEAKDNGFDQVQPLSQNLPELALADIQLDSRLAGRKMTRPFFLNAVTGGSPQAQKINESFARVAAKTGLAMAVGSQSITFKLEESLPSFTRVRELNPDGLLLANLGAHHPLVNAQKAVDQIQADILELHVNAAQELTMPEGDRDFFWQDNIATAVNSLLVPVIVKEVGFGMSPRSLLKLANLGVKYVDLAGKGGTSFVQIENFRRPQKELAFLDNLALTTAQSLILAQPYREKLSLTASGGIRTAQDIVKALILGADNVGISGHFLHVLLKQGEVGLEEEIHRLTEEIKLIMLLLGCQTIAELQQVPYVLTGQLKDYQAFNN